MENNSSLSYLYDTVTVNVNVIKPLTYMCCAMSLSSYSFTTYL